MWSFTEARTRRRLANLIGDGVGVHRRSWRGSERSADGLLQWVRDGMAGMRRPNGINQVALALACRDTEGALRRSSSLGVVPPAAFYGGRGEDGLRAFLVEVGELPAEDQAEVSAALVCLGDLAFALGE